jgi:hypothetical protein
MQVKPTQQAPSGDNGGIGHTVTENNMSQMDESFLKAEDAVGDEKQAGTPHREKSLENDLYFQIQKGDRPSEIGGY